MIATLRANIVANLVATVVVGASAVLSAPLLFRSFGPEAYAFVGVYILAQTFMPLLDLGLIPGLSRAMAWHRGRGEFGEVGAIIKIARVWIASISVIVFILAWLSVPWISGLLLDRRGVDELNADLLLSLMAAALCARMSASLERAALMANEQQIASSTIQAAAAFARTFGAYWVSMYFNLGIIGFFALQMPIALFEWSAYRWRLLIPATCSPIVDASERISHLRFGARVTLLSALWLVGSQIDKLVLITSLPLAEYGSYSLAAHLAVATMLVSGAVNAAFLPAMTAMAARGEQDRLRDAYGLAAILVMGLSVSWTIVLGVGGATLMPAFRTATAVDPILLGTMLSAGNVAVALVALTYMLQSAYGDLRLHSFGTVAMSMVQVCVVGAVAVTGDTWNVAAAYAALSWCFAIVWIPVVHAKFFRDGWRWFSGRMAPSILTSVCAAGFAVLVRPLLPESLLPAAACVFAMGAATLILVVAVDPEGRRLLRVKG